MVKMVGVDSSNISAIGHAGLTLSVTFKNGKTYHYANVPEEKYQALLAASSKGSHFATHIKPFHPVHV